jgi:CRP-like cAMP-binding protein
MFTPQSKLFKGLKPQAIDEIVKLGIQESLPRGAFVYKKGDPTRFFYVLKEGKVRLRIGEEGQIDYMACDPGEAFGLSCLAGQEAFATSAECLEDSKLVKIDKDKLAQVFEKDPASGLAFYRVLAELLNQRLLKTHGMVLAAYKGAGPPSYG